MNNALKKKGKAIVDKFKKHYDGVVKNEDLLKPESLDKVNSFWLGQLIDPELKREIIRQMGNEPLELKLAFNLNTAFRGAIPQKLWCLGDAHSVAHLTREACNSLKFSLSSILHSTLENTVFIEFHVNEYSGTAPCQYLISDTCFRINVDFRTTSPHDSIINLMSRQLPSGDLEYETSENTADNSEKWLTKEEVNSLRPYEPPRRREWAGDEIVLQENGELFWATRRIDIYLNDNKVENKRILQFDVKDSEIIILWESFFLAIGTVRKTRTGTALIDCVEMGGTYPTSFFAISPDFKLIARQSVFVPEIPRSTAVINEMNFGVAVKNSERLLQSDARKFLQHSCEETLLAERGERFEVCREGLLKIFCSDIQLFLGALEEGLDPSLEALCLTEREKLVVTTRRHKREFEMADDPCVGFDADCCPHFKKFVEFARKHFDDMEKEDAEEMDDKTKEIVYLTSQMLGFMSESLIMMINESRFSQAFLCETKDVKNWYQKQDSRFSRTFYFPLEIYEKNFSSWELGSDASIMTRDDLNERGLCVRMPKKFARILSVRPDLLFFGTCQFHVPLAVLNKFVELHPRFVEVHSQGAEWTALEHLTFDFCQWSVKEPKEYPGPSRPGSKPSTSSG